jgi:hypothetical protein
MRIILIPLIAALTLSSPARAFNFGKELGNCFQGGCDVVWGVNQRSDAGIQSKASSLFGPARDAFIQAMTDLFDKKLNPFLDRVNNDLSARIEQAGDRADKIVNETTDGILKIIDAAGDLSDKTSGDVQKIISLAFRETDALVNKINADISQLIDDIDCKVNGTYQGVIDYFRQLVTLPHPANSCYRDLGYILSVPDGTDTINWYRITKCVWTQDLDNSRTTEDIKNNYARLSVLARRMKCITQDALATQLANEDSKKYAQSFEIWLLSSR